VAGESDDPFNPPVNVVPTTIYWDWLNVRGCPCLFCHAVSVKPGNVVFEHVFVDSVAEIELAGVKFFWGHSVVFSASLVLNYAINEACYLGVYWVCHRRYSSLGEQNVLCADGMEKSIMFVVEKIGMLKKWLLLL
jgi:hypothetical protein